MKVAALIPLWGADPARMHAWKFVHRHLRALNLSMYGGGGAVSRAAAINRAARLNEVCDTDVYLINDADSLAPHAQILEALTLARDAPGLVYCYRSYWRLTRAVTEALTDPNDLFRADSEDPDFEWHLRDAPSTGCVAIRRECFEQVSGFDERFVGWGYEDLAFLRSCEAHWPTRRVEGDLYHLWHDSRRDDDSPLSEDVAAVERNRRLYEQEYARA